MTKQGRGDDEVDEPKQIEKIKSDRTEVIEICDSSWLIANRSPTKTLSGIRVAFQRKFGYPPTDPRQRMMIEIEWND